MTAYTAVVEVTTFVRVEFEAADDEAPGTVAIATVQSGAGYREMPSTFAVAQISKRHPAVPAPLL